jgi:haloacetate dehalogenase
VAEYERVFADPDARHAMMEDYRAGASIDLEHDRADAGRRVEVPLLAMWGTRGVVGTGPDNPVAVWRERATDVSGVGIDAGHYLVEERPEECLAAIARFLEG